MSSASSTSLEIAAGEAAAGLHGANRLGGNSLSDLLVFGQRAGEFAARFAKEHRAGRIDEKRVEQAVRDALEPFGHPGGDGEGPYKVQQDLQGMMQDLVGIVRRQEEMERALEGIGKLEERARRVRVDGNRQYNPGWHTALDLRSLLTVSEAVTRAALERKESRGAQFRDDYPKKDEACGRFNIVLRKGPDGEMQVSRRPLPAVRPDLQQIIEENK